MTLSIAAVDSAINGTSDADGVVSGTVNASTETYRLMLVFVTYERGTGRSISGITYNGVALSHVATENTATASFTEHMEVWELEGPASGSNTLQVTSASGSFSDYGVGVIVVAGTTGQPTTGTAQTNYSSSATSMSETVAIGAGDAIVGNVSVNAGSIGTSMTPDSGCTEQYEVSTAGSSGFTHAAPTRIEASGGSYGVGESSGRAATDMVIIAVPVAEGGGGGATIIPGGLQDVGRGFSGHYAGRTGGAIE